MNDYRPTNEKIAEMLQQQTYSERMELADWLREAINDQKSDMGPEDGFKTDDIAQLLSIWADAELAEEDTP